MKILTSVTLGLEGSRCSGRISVVSHLRTGNSYAAVQFNFHLHSHKSLKNILDVIFCKNVGTVSHFLFKLQLANEWLVVQGARLFKLFSCSAS